MNFDNTYVAISTLFQMMTTAGWQGPMFAAIDSTEINKQPIYNNNFYHVFFFTSFMVVGFLFLVNLFVGVIIDNFNKITDQIGAGGAFVTPK